ncbi:metal-dependent hydrolase [Methanoregula sp.]|uniref:metal-dependent hydrolase n=1 Tax=Methanoregula sp. TaxID=2052170 RepID=UPI0026219D6B|nr:metal-dependent hydrolase [Methanoregula sp.]MDD5142012.1 metal-dependent hydrolase [Methanoregula sp.]
MQITWLGHSCVLLTGSKKVLIDPFIEGGSVAGTSPDLVAVTHGHDDHMGEAVAIGKKTVAITEIAKYLKGKGVPVEGMNIGGTQVVDGVSFTMTAALHSTFIVEAGEGFSGGAPAGFVIGMDGVKVYHAGDTGLFSDMKLIGDLYHPDVALLPIGGRYTMGVAEAMMAANFIGAKIVIPIHYNTWDRIKADPVVLKNGIERTTDLAVRILAPGESIEITPE